MKTIQQLYAELGLAPSRTKTASKSKEDAVIDFLKKIAESDVNQSPDPSGTQQVPTNLSDMAANRPDGTTDPSQTLRAMNAKGNKAMPVDPDTLNTSSLPILEGGAVSHRLGEVQNQAPAEAVLNNPNDLESKEALARQIAAILKHANASSITPDVDLDTVFKVAYINDYLGRQAAQAAMLKMAQEEAAMAPPTMDVPPQVEESDPTEEILALLGQVSADELVAKKDALLSAIADVLDAEGESEEEFESEEEAEEAKEAAAKLLNIIHRNPAMRHKVAAMLRQ